MWYSLDLNVNLPKVRVLFPLDFTHILFFWLYLRHTEFQGQSHSSDNTRSLTHWATGELWPIFPIYTMRVGRGKLLMLRPLHSLHSKIILMDGDQYWLKLRQRNHSAQGGFFNAMLSLTMVPNKNFPDCPSKQYVISAPQPPSSIHTTSGSVLVVFLELQLPSVCSRRLMCKDHIWSIIRSPHLAQYLVHKR